MSIKLQALLAYCQVFSVLTSVIAIKLRFSHPQRETSKTKTKKKAFLSSHSIEEKALFENVTEGITNRRRLN